MPKRKNDKILQHLSSIHPKGASMKDLQLISKFATNEVDMMIREGSVCQVNILKNKINCVYMCINDKKLRQRNLWQDVDPDCAKKESEWRAF